MLLIERYLLRQFALGVAAVAAVVLLVGLGGLGELDQALLERDGVGEGVVEAGEIRSLPRAETKAGAVSRKGSPRQPKLRCTPVFAGLPLQSGLPNGWRASRWSASFTFFVYFPHSKRYVLR